MECSLPCMEEREMLHVGYYNVEIYFPKIGFLDFKWTNLNVTGSYTTWCHLLFGPIMERPLPCMEETEMLHLGCYKVETCFPKLGFLDFK